MEKIVILEVLNKSIGDLITFDDKNIDKIIFDSHITQSLCSSIEAMFLHGEINSNTAEVLSKFGRIKQPYEYDFWNFIVEFIPQNIMQTLRDYNFKLTSIGLCRVWLRLSLNESTIISYLESILKDKNRLKRFYNKSALIRDEKLMENFCGFLKSIEHIVFQLDTSLPVLNTWLNSDALRIAGLQHHSSTKSNINTESISSLSNINSVSFNKDDNSLTLMFSNEEEIMPKNILSGRLNSCISASTDLSLPISPKSNTSSSHQINDFNDVFNVEDNVNINFNELDSGVGDVSLGQPININTDLLNDDIHALSFDENKMTNCENKLHTVESLSEKTFVDNSTAQNDKDVLKSNNEMNENSEDVINVSGNENIIENKISQDSSDQLFSRSNIDVIKLIEEVDIVKIDEKQESSQVLDSQSNELESPKVYSSYFTSRLMTSTTDFFNNILQRRFPYRLFRVKESDQSWVFIGDELLARNADLKKLMEIFPGVSKSSVKSGENSVSGGVCHKCHRSLERDKIFLDYYDGEIYCLNCESKTKSVIPRDIISNWDFTTKSVSETTKKFLSEIMVHPNINLATNSCLFDIVPELSRVRTLRHKLSLLWLQVTSCDIETSTKVRQAMFPREYMLASVKEKDLYALEDLIILRNGVLERTLSYVIDKIAVPHVNKCLVCRMKALACDKCRDENNLIYIHDIEYYSECSTRLCQSVVHNSCKNSTTTSFYCRRCVQYLENQQTIILDSFDTADLND